MKSLLFTLISSSLVFVVLCQLSEKEIQLFQVGKVQCKKEAGSDFELTIKNLEDGANNKEFKCYLKCLFVAIGGLSESGELVVERLKLLPSDLKREVWGKVIDECKNVTDNDKCEMAYKVSKCLTDKEKQLRH